MARREIERLTGLGTIFADDHLLRRIRYDLTVLEDAEGEGDESPSVAVEGSIDLSGIGEAVVLAGPQPLTLRLEDGRRVVFTLASSSGRIRVHGRVWPA